MTSTTATSATSWRPDQIGEIDVENAIPDLHLVDMTTRAGEVDGDEPSVRVPFVSVDPTASTVAEGAQIAPSDPTRAEVVIGTRKTAVLTIVSNELIRQPGAQGRLLDSVQRAVTQTANRDFMAALAEEAASGWADGGALGSTHLDALGDLLTDLGADGADPSHIVMRAADWKVIQTIKTSTGSNAPLVGVGVGEAQARRLFGVKVVVTNDLPAGATGNKILVISKPDLVSAYGSLLLAKSEDYAFDSDSTAIRATLRFGVKSSRPARFGFLTGVDETP